MNSKRNRWASDLSMGLLIASIGLLVLGLATIFWAPLIGIALGVVYIGLAVCAFAGFEYFNSVVDAHRVEDPRV